MAKIIGTITTSHVPAIGGAIARGLQNDPYWKPFFDGFPPVRDWLAKMKPDVVVMVYNDHGLNFFLDKMPTFAVGAAPEYHNADEGWGIPTLPSAARCYKLGQAIGRAIQSWDSDKRVVVVGTGGLSHQLDGERAGFINKDFDLQFMESLTSDPTWATKYSIADLVELAGTQGIELLMWLATRGALTGQVKKVQANYHIPISNTAAGLMVMENHA